MATAEAVRQVTSIVTGDKERKYIVVSAPGKMFGDIKITDQLYQLADELLTKGTMRGYVAIRNRFLAIAGPLGLTKKVEALLDETKEEILKVKKTDFIVSRGEYMMANLMAWHLDYPFVDAKDLVRFKKDKIDYGRTNRLMHEHLKKKAYVIIPGFYGQDDEGNIKVFSRGGGDVSGALVARGVGAEVYENWTDVDGFLAADPRIVDNPKLIEQLTYKELRVLSFMGASVLHSEAYYPVSKAGIPIHIRNTFNPSSKGTKILPSIDGEKNKTQITGIAGLKNFTLIVVEKELMSDIVGYDRKILSIAEKMDINVEHFPSGTDTFSMMIESRYLGEGKKAQLVAQIKKSLKPDTVEVHDNISVISIVGRNLMSSNQNMFRFFSALVNANITLKMIDYGSNGVNIVIGVNDEDYLFAIQAIYNEFVGKETRA